MDVRRLLIVIAVATVAVGCGRTTAQPEASAAAPPTPATSGGRDRLVWHSLTPANWDVYYFSRLGDTPRRLTDFAGLDYDAVQSPDGQWVVFTSERRGHPDLYVVSTQGGEARLLVDGATMEDQAAISPDGSTVAFVSDLGGNADIYSLPFRPNETQAMTAARNLTNSPGGDFRPSFSPDGQRIAFSSDRDTPVGGHPFLSFTRQREGEIYVMNSDGTGARRLTTAPNWDGSPVFASDGQTIFFYSGRDHKIGPPSSPILGQEGGFELWAMNADGSRQRRLTAPGVEALSPAITPDGRVAFQTRDGFANWSIVTVRPDGSDLRRETDGKTNYWNVSFNAMTGSMVAHGVGSSGAESQAVEAILGPGPLLQPGHPQAFAHPDLPGELATYPMRHTTGLAPHPTRNEVLVTIENEQGSRLVHANYDGSDSRELFFLPGVGIIASLDSRTRMFDIKWSGDGNAVNYTLGAFFGGLQDRADIWTMRPDGSERRNLSEELGGKVNEGIATFSPDGSRMVFRSARNGNLNLYLRDMNTGAVTQLTDGKWRDNFPVFSPSGNQIAFSSDRDGPTDQFGFRTFDVYILDLAPDGKPGMLRRLTNHPGQDSHPFFSPDGQWITYTTEADGIKDEEPVVQEVVFAPQMYGEVVLHRLSDGLTIRVTHNKWEEGLAQWLVPNDASVVSATR